MDLDQQNNPDFRVLRGQNNQWHVTAQDYRQPLASFDSLHAACAWAIARAKPKRRRVFVEETFVDYSSFTTGSQDRSFIDPGARDVGNHPPPRAFLLTGKTGAR